VAPTVQRAVAAKNATTTIPIVMVNVGDPVESGLVASLARPGGNVTGLSRSGTDLIGKNLQLLAEAVPRAIRVAVLSNPTNPPHPILARNAKKAASRWGGSSIRRRTRPNELEGAFSLWPERAQARCSCLATGCSEPTTRPISRSASPAVDVRQHGACGSRGLMSYAPNSVDPYRAPLPTWTKFSKVRSPPIFPSSNPRSSSWSSTSNREGVRADHPPSVLGRADQVIE